MKYAIAIVIVSATWTSACSQPGRAAPPQGTTSSLPKLDAGAWLACRELASVNQDARAGVLSDGELRAGIARVYSHARVFPNSLVAGASAALLRELTGGTVGSALRDASASLIRACAQWEQRTP
jgi:hypothetical protein